ncbi:MAG: ThiF family adenylyltransferase [Desulfobacterales bacterium]|nr:ThiF family adenylyltransferase [Desulfobacterales bacterium]
MKHKFKDILKSIQEKYHKSSFTGFIIGNYLHLTGDVIYWTSNGRHSKRLLFLFLNSETEKENVVAYLPDNDKKGVRNEHVMRHGTLCLTDEFQKKLDFHQAYERSANLFALQDSRSISTKNSIILDVDVLIGSNLYQDRKNRVVFFSPDFDDNSKREAQIYLTECTVLNRYIFPKTSKPLADNVLVEQSENSKAYTIPEWSNLFKYSDEKKLEALYISLPKRLSKGFSNIDGLVNILSESSLGKISSETYMDIIKKKLEIDAGNFVIIISYPSVNKKIKAKLVINVQKISFFDENKNFLFEKYKFFKIWSEDISDINSLMRGRIKGLFPESLESKTVAIVGLGNIGGFLSLSLAHAGIRRFILIDPDYLNMGNLTRHPLDMRFIGKNKAKGMAERLKLSFPDIEVSAYNQGFEHDKKFSKTPDLIVDCTANYASLEEVARFASLNNISAVSAWLTAGGSLFRVHAQLFPETDTNQACIACIEKYISDIESEKMGWVRYLERYNQAILPNGSCSQTNAIIAANLDTERGIGILSSFIIQILSNQKIDKFNHMRIITRPPDSEKCFELSEVKIFKDHLKSHPDCKVCSGKNTIKEPNPVVFSLLSFEKTDEELESKIINLMALFPFYEKLNHEESINFIKKLAGYTFLRWRNRGFIKEEPDNISKEFQEGILLLAGNPFYNFSEKTAILEMIFSTGKIKDDEIEFLKAQILLFTKSYKFLDESYIKNYNQESDEK